MKKNRFKMAWLLFIGIFLLVLITGYASGIQASKASNFGQKNPASYRGELNVWAHTPDQPTFMIQNYNKLYPNVKINLTIIPGTEQQQKIMNAVASGVNVPDIFTVRTQFVKLFVESDSFYANLLAAPYDARQIVKATEPYIISVGSDAKDALKALSWQCPVGGIYYRRGLAREFFGNDDPEFISSKFSSYDTLLNTAREINKKSNGKVKFVCHYWQLAFMMKSAAKNGYVVDGKLNIDPMLEEYFKLAKIFHDENLDLKIKPNTPNQYAAMENGRLFGYIFPTWGLNYNIMPNHPKSSGDWGLAAGPNPYTAGGTYMGIYTKTKNPELAWTFVNYVFSNENFISSYAMNLGDYVSNKAVQQKYGNMPAAQTAELPLFKFMANQNIYQFFNNELAKGVNSKTFSKYDEFFNRFLDNACEQYATGLKSWDDAWKQFKQDCKSYAPELIVK